MALPTLEKTWQFSVNQAYGGTGLTDNDNKDLLLKIKNALKSFASGQWTVTSSSNGSSFGLSDLWITIANLSFDTGSNNHSWIVLTNSATGAELCIDCNVASSSTENAPIYMSPGGGYATTGLSLTSRPTPPADELLISTSGYGGDSGAATGKFHAMMSSDGECTRVVVCRNNAAVGLWLLDAVKNPGAGWANSNVGVTRGNTSDTDILTYTVFKTSSSPVKGYIASAVTLSITGEAYSTLLLGESAIGAAPDDQDAGWIMAPMGLVSVTAGNLGRKGALYDLWWGSTVRSTGDTYPNDVTYQFAQFGDIIFPWAGVTPQVS